MKISSPFIQCILDCKRKMRRLRKKIYKYLNNKTRVNSGITSGSSQLDVLPILGNLRLPRGLKEQLYKTKALDITALKTMTFTPGVPLEDMIEMTRKQEQTVLNNQLDWQEYNRMRQNLAASRASDQEESSSKLKEMESKRTLSSTEMSCQENEDMLQLQEYCEQEHSQERLEWSAGPNQLSPFMRLNGFLQMESSILSQENIFRFD